MGMEEEKNEGFNGNYLTVSVASFTGIRTLTTFLKRLCLRKGKILWASKKYSCFSIY